VISLQRKILADSVQSITTEKLVPEDVKNKLTSIFGAKFDHSMKSVEEGRVKRITFNPSRRVVWQISGKGRDYVILSNAEYCSCEDFYFRVIDHEEILCYHLLAQKIAEALGRYSAVEEPDQRYEDLVLRIARKGEKTRKLPIEETERIRRVIAEALSEQNELPLEKLIETIDKAGFPHLSRRHLTAILTADKSKRFQTTEGLWSLRTKK
jgi:predicted nucleic acid-binding Zn finger protein